MAPTPTTPSGQSYRRSTVRNRRLLKHHEGCSTQCVRGPPQTYDQERGGGVKRRFGVTPPLPLVLGCGGPLTAVPAHGTSIFD